MKRVVCSVIAVAMLAAVSVAALAGDEKKPAVDPAQQAMMQAWMPGEHHEHMKALVGNFDYTIKVWSDPTTAPSESTGKRSAEMILGGRYLSEKYSGVFMGMPFEGTGTLAYDNTQKKYLSTWIDNMSTGIMVATGQCEKGPAWTMNGEMADPMSGKMVPTRSVTKVVDADHLVFEMYCPGPDGKEFKMMEIAATRTK
jgi:hypothetical protein